MGGSGCSLLRGRSSFEWSSANRRNSLSDSRRQRLRISWLDVKDAFIDVKIVAIGKFIHLSTIVVR